MACGSKEECPQKWEKWNRHEEYVLDREQFRAWSDCGDNSFMFSDRMTPKQCWSQAKQGRKHSCRCVDKQQLQDFKRWQLRSSP